jgi:phosphoribosylformylglycinamidine cyclo-ligase
VSDAPITYASAGVDVEAGDRAVELMKASVRRASRPEVLGGLGGFAGMFDASAIAGMTRPILATSTDGVGTKVAIAQALDVHDTIGFDLVGMVVDDIVVCGAEPLFMTDYIATGKVVPERIAAIVGGIARACEEAGVALVGGETAEHPGLVVEYAAVLGPQRVADGDVVVALASSGLHSNGYSLVRRVLASAGWALDRHVDDFGRSLGEELLEPTRIYTRPLLELIADEGVDVHALSHVTGGGLAANLARVLPAGTFARVDRSTWSPPAVFRTIQELGRVPQSDLERTLNQGIGFVAVLPESGVERAIEVSERRGIKAWRLGEVADEERARSNGLMATDAEVVRGAKGVDGGAVQVVGVHPSA